jgi:hypothetical protein
VPMQSLLNQSISQQLSTTVLFLVGNSAPLLVKQMCGSRSVLRSKNNQLQLNYVKGQAERTVIFSVF